MLAINENEKLKHGFSCRQDTSVQCMMGSMDNATTMTMCHKFSRRRGSKTFSKMMTSGVDCVSALMKSRHSRTDDDDDDDDDDVSMVRTLLNQGTDRSSVVDGPLAVRLVVGSIPPDGTVELFLFPAIVPHMV